jgi:hypothetical protein
LEEIPRGRRSTMKTRRIHPGRSGKLAAASLAALLVLAGTVAAQTPATLSWNHNSGPTPDVGRAAELELRAEALCSQFTGKKSVLVRIARLFEEAATLRADDDPRRAADHDRAAAMYVHAGKLDAALRNETAAAELHLMNGRVVEAAHRFITAATVAQRAGKHDVVAQLAHRAEMLCNCPMMDPFAAQQIHQRIAHSGRVLVVRR